MKIERKRMLSHDKDKLKGFVSTKSALPRIPERNVHIEEKGKHTLSTQERTKCTTAADAQVRLPKFQTFQNSHITATDSLSSSDSVLVAVTLRSKDTD